jgi:hypothetical protein
MFRKAKLRAVRDELQFFGYSAVGLSIQMALMPVVKCTAILWGGIPAFCSGAGLNQQALRAGGWNSRNYQFDSALASAKEGMSEEVVPNISQETLAEMVGTARSRVNFFMNRFRKLGFIDHNGGLIVHSSLLGVVLHD